MFFFSAVILKFDFILLIIYLQSIKSDNELVSWTKEGGRRIIKISRDVCYSEGIPAMNLTFPVVWTPRGNICEHPTIVKRECCEGYDVAELEKGCPLVDAVDYIFTKAKQLDGNKFIKMAENHLLHRHFELLHDHAVTLLLPNDQGFENRDNVTNSELLRLVEVQNHLHIPPLLLYHFLLRRFHTAHLQNEEELPTMYFSNSVIVSKLNKKMILFNCIPVTRINIHARDGIIHQLHHPLAARYAQTLADVLSTHQELSLFRNLIGYAQMLSWVRTQGQITILAPTNSALNKLPSSFLDSIMYDKRYFAALQAFVKNHIIQGLHCSLALRILTHIKTFEGQVLSVNCPESFNISLSGMNITTKDVLATNGVLHYLDGVNLPPKAKSLSQVLRDVTATKFFALCRRVGLIDQITSRGPYTIFAPSNKAFKAINGSIAKNSTALRELLLHHITMGSHSSYTMKDNLALQTLGGSYSLLPVNRLSWKHILRVRVHAKRVTVGDAVVVSGDHEAFNGRIHLIDKILSPAELTISESLLHLSGAQRFNELLSKSKKNILQELLLKKGPFTIFVVLDKDMDRWASDMFTYYRILGDELLLNKTLSAHILDDYVMPRGLIEGSHTTLISRVGRYEPLHMTLREGAYSLRYASVSSNFIICSNGIILFVDALITPSSEVG